MKIIGRTVAMLAMIVGGLVAGWAPAFFETITGQALPPSGEPNHMAVRAGVSFAFGFGALLLVVGAILWALMGDGGRVAVLKALVGFGSLAALLVWAQAQAIWSTAPGFGLALLLACIAMASMAALYVERTKYQPADM